MENELLRRLGEGCISGSAGILLVWVLGRFLPRLPGVLRCWLWWLVSLKLLTSLLYVPPVAVPVLPPTTAQLPQRVITVIAGLPVHQLPGKQQSGSVGKTETLQDNRTTATDNTSDIPAAAPWNPVSLLMGVWLLGIGVCIGTQAMALVQLRRLTAGATRRLHPVMEEAAQRVGLRRTPALWESPSSIEPLTMGGWRPCILIAEDDIARLSGSELLSVLTHECVHIRRGDLLLSFVPWLAQTLFWFLPPVYLAMREFQLAREVACDQQTVVVLAIAPKTYGELLVKLSSPISPMPIPSSALALSAGFEDLKRRIQMLELKPSRRRVLVTTTFIALGLLAPWRFTIASPLFQSETLPNLDFSDGLKHWHKMANGSDEYPHPFYNVGIESTLKREGKPSGYVASGTNIAEDVPGDGGVLRYDLLDVRKYKGKRLRWSGYMQGKGIANHAFLFLAAETEKGLYFATSRKIGSNESGWNKIDCVMDVPESAADLFMGIRLEGAGIAYGNTFTLEIVDKTVSLSPLETHTPQDAADDESITKGLTAPANLRFAQGLQEWWNDNPTHYAWEDYSLELVPKVGRNGNTAALLQNKVKKPRSYGTIAQNALPTPYLGKRVRFSAYLKGENVDAGDLWIVIGDKNPQNSTGKNRESGGKTLQGTTDWTRFEYVVDIPTTTQALSFGISSEGKGKIWVDGFAFEIIGPIPR